MSVQLHCIQALDTFLVRVQTNITPEQRNELLTSAVISVVANGWQKLVNYWSGGRLDQSGDCKLMV